MRIVCFLILACLGCKNNYVYEIVIDENTQESRRYYHNNYLPFDTLTNGFGTAYRFGILYDSGEFVNGKREGFHKISRICVNQEFNWNSFFSDWYYTNENYFIAYFKDGIIYQVSAKLKDSIQHVVKVNESNANFQLITSEFDETDFGTFISNTSTYVYFNLNYNTVRFRYKSRDGKQDTILASKNLPYIRIRDNLWIDFQDSIFLVKTN